MGFPHTKNGEIMEEVEGEWKHGLMFRVADLEDYERLREFLQRNYYRDEPIHQMLGWCTVKAADLDKVIAGMLPHRMTLFAEHLDTGKIAGVRVAVDGRLGFDMKHLNLKSPHNFKIMHVKDKLIEMVQSLVDSEYSGKNYGGGFLASVDPEWRGKGLATELYRRSMTLFKRSGFDFARNFFSSNVTRGIVTKLGYKELSRIYLRDVYDDNGERLFPMAQPEDFANFMAIKF